MTQILHGVLELQNALTQLKEAERRMREIPDWMRELHEEHAARRAEIEVLEGVADAAGRDRRNAEAAVQDAQEKLKKYQQQINRVSNQREYGALLQEIDTVKAEISAQEEAGIAALGRADQAQQDLRSQREAFRDLDDRYTAELARWEEEKPEVAKTAEGLRQRVADLKGGLSRGV